MTLDEKKTEMAIRRLDWEPKESWTLAGRVKHGFHWWNNKTGVRAHGLPDYPNDANSRKDILAVMTEEELREYAILVLDKCVGALDWENLSTRKLLISLTIYCFQLSQPEFFELAGQAMGLWEA